MHSCRAGGADGSLAAHDQHGGDGGMRRRTLTHSLSHIHTGLAAMVFGAGEAVGVEIDPDSIAAAHANAAINNLVTRTHTCTHARTHTHTHITHTNTHTPTRPHRYTPTLPHSHTSTHTTASQLHTQTQPTPA